MFHLGSLHALVMGDVMVLVLKKGVVFESDSKDIYTIALARSSALGFDNALATFTANYALSKMPITNDIFLNEFVGVCFSSDDKIIGRIFRVFESKKQKFFGMFEVKESVRVAELFLSRNVDRALGLMNAMLDESIVAIPVENARPEISGELITMQEYPVLKAVPLRSK